MLRYRVSVMEWLIRDAIRAKALKPLAYVRLLQYALLHRRNAARYEYLMDAHRFHPTPFAARRLARNLVPIAEHAAISESPPREADLKRAVRRTIVLKNPGLVGGRFEKGVLLIAFTETFRFFAQHVDCGPLLDHFYVVLEPSWAGYAEASILFWTRFKDSPVLVQSPERRDYEFIESLASNLVPIETGFSDWVDLRVFRPLENVAKDFDAIYVANYNPIKRHHVLFRALRALRDPGYRVALVCSRVGGTRQAIETLLEHYGVRRQVELFEQVPQTEVNALLNRSKVCVLLSLKEGGNRSIFEGLFADVPAIVLRSNIGVNKAYINDATGRLVEERELVPALREFRTGWSKYRPRDWAMANIAPWLTAVKISNRLRAVAVAAGQPWSEDVVPKVNAPEVRHFHDRDAARLLPARMVVTAFLKDIGGSREARQAFRQRLGA